MSVLDWNESQVNQFFISLGLTRYELAIKEHALTGDVLIHLDNELLKDIGIKSVGKRLTILKAIYKLKIKEDIPIEDGNWIPPLGDLEQDGSEPDSQSDLSPILATPPTPHHQPSSAQPQQPDSLNHLFFLRDQRIKTLESDVRSIKQELQSLSARFPALSSTPNSPNLLVEAVPPTPSTRTQGRHMREESLRQLDIHDPSPASPAPSQTNPIIPSQEDPKRSQPPSPNLTSTTHSTQEVLQTHLLNKCPSPATETLSISATPKPTDRISQTEKQTSKENDSKERDNSNPYKSFRVTLEDPCYKVLPAALKKYKINEHYKNYVLFICYGKQERCLSYEEKPLLLFQKLKEANQNPVFTLRHIKDIESPVSLALAKQAQRREKKLANSSQKQANTGDSKDAATVSQPRKAPPNAGRVEKASGFCIAIYPYMSEGGDDFDVGVGDTFIIVGKSKGWWVVNRDKGPETQISEDHQGWIPSGCLLETKKSFSVGTTGKVKYDTTILPDEILSVSSACYGLMDYKAKGNDELGFDIKDRLKVYKKYNNWSYAINESKPDKPRGWTPSWLIGTRKDKEGGGTTSPISTNTTGTVATTTTTTTTGSTANLRGGSSSSSSSSSVETRALNPSLSSSSSSSLFDRHRIRTLHQPSRASSDTSSLSTSSDSTAASVTTVTPATSVFASHKLPPNHLPLPADSDSNSLRNFSLPSSIPRSIDPTLSPDPSADLSNVVT